MGVVSGSGCVGVVFPVSPVVWREMPGLGGVSSDGPAGGEGPSSPGWLSSIVGSSGICANLHGAGFWSERRRNVLLNMPLRQCSASMELVGLISLRMMFAMACCVSGSIRGQMAMPERDVRAPMSLSLVRACWHAYVSCLMFG